MRFFIVLSVSIISSTPYTVLRRLGRQRQRIHIIACQDKFYNAFSNTERSIQQHRLDTDLQTEGSGNDKEIQIRIDAIHHMVGSEGTAKLPLKLESAGTLKMFALYPLLQNVLDTGGVLFVDELNARLHPLLVRTVVITFLNPETNPKHAQLIFTSHDAWQLNSNMLRRDEVWFVEKADTGISTLYSLADFVDEDA